MSSSRIYDTERLRRLFIAVDIDDLFNETSHLDEFHTKVSEEGLQFFTKSVTVPPSLSVHGACTLILDYLVENGNILQVYVYREGPNSKAQPEAHAVVFHYGFWGAGPCFLDHDPDEDLSLWDEYLVPLLQKESQCTIHRSTDVDDMQAIA